MWRVFRPCCQSRKRAWRTGRGVGRGIVEPRGDNPMRSPPLYCTAVREPLKLSVGIKRSNLVSGDKDETPATQTLLRSLFDRADATRFDFGSQWVNPAACLLA